MDKKQFQPSKRISHSPGQGLITSFCFPPRGPWDPEYLNMTRDEALPDSYSAQGFYENYEPKEILGR
jgi:hypothetical protein